MTFSFGLVRTVGGDSLIHTKNKRMQKMLAQLDDRPVMTVFFLRAVLFAAPPLNFALALSRVSFKHYIIGSGVGVVPMLTVFALAVDWFVSTHQMLSAGITGGPTDLQPSFSMNLSAMNLSAASSFPLNVTFPVNVTL